MKNYKVHTLEELRKLAEEYGCTLAVASPSQLFLDLDSYTVIGDDVHASEVFHEWRDHNETRLALVNEKFVVEGFQHWRSRRGHLHVVIDLGMEVERYAAIALEASLGSDPRRQILAVYEAMTSVEDTRSLFRPKVPEPVAKPVAMDDDVLF